MPRGLLDNMPHVGLMRDQNQSYPPAEQSFMDVLGVAPPSALYQWDDGSTMNSYNNMVSQQAVDWQRTDAASAAALEARDARGYFDSTKVGKALTKDNSGLLWGEGLLSSIGDWWGNYEAPESALGKAAIPAQLATALVEGVGEGIGDAQEAAQGYYNTGGQQYVPPIFNSTLDTMIAGSAANVATKALSRTPELSDYQKLMQNQFGANQAGGKAAGAAAFGDWRWRSPGEVRDELGLTEIPGHVQKFGTFMAGQTEKARSGNMTARDIIKAFTITRSSIQRGAVDADKVRAAGLDIPGDGKIRPEGAFAEWLMTPMGKQYLDGAENGIADADSIADAVKVMAPFGRHTTDIPDALVTAAQGLDPDRAIALLADGDTAGWRDYAKGLRGIGPAKQGFVGSLLGEGSIPTLDARQIKLHTGKPTKDASSRLARKGWGDKAVNRLAKRQADMDLDLPKELEPYRQHLTHHTVWDKVSNEVTTHDDLMRGMTLAANTAGKGSTAAAVGGGLLNRELTDIPILDPRDLAGATIFPTLADLTRTGRAYEGIDSSRLDNPEPMPGGPGYAAVEDAQIRGLIWATQGDSTAAAKLEKGKKADFMTVNAMSPTTHMSNATFANSVIKTVGAYARDGRITKTAINTIGKAIRRMGKDTTQKELKALKDFPGFNHPDLPAFMARDNLSFQARLAISKMLTSKDAQDLGMPSVERIRQETVDPQYAGANPMDTLMILEPDWNKGFGKLDLNDPLDNTSFQHALAGSVVGRFENPASGPQMYPDAYAAREGKNAANTYRSISLERPHQLLTKPQMAGVHEAVTYGGIASPRQGLVLYDAMSGQWSRGSNPMGMDRVKPADFSNALKNNPSSSSLSQYSQSDINKGLKAGTLETYQLGDKDIFFAIDKAPDYSWMGTDAAPVVMRPDDKSLVGVVSNETNAQGIAAPAVMGKALEDGVTVLDAYAVKSAAHPDGFLPGYYSEFGFEVEARVPFSQKVYLEDHTIHEYNDMLHQWKKDGWVESDGYPDVVMMRWSGTDADRAGSSQRIFSEGQAHPRPEDTQLNTGAKQPSTVGADEPLAGKGRQRGPGNASVDNGSLRAGDGTPVPGRSSQAVTGLLNLTDTQAKNIGIDPAGLSAIRSGLLSP